MQVSLLGGAAPVVEQPAKTKARPSEAVVKPGMYLQPAMYLVCLVMPIP